MKSSYVRTKPADWFIQAFWTQFSVGVIIVDYMATTRIDSKLDLTFWSTYDNDKIPHLPNPHLQILIRHGNKCLVTSRTHSRMFLRERLHISHLDVATLYLH